MSNATESQTTPRDFEEAMSELEQIVEQLEEGDLKLEAALQTFERGIALARHCQTELENAEQRVRVLSETRDDDRDQATDQGSMESGVD